MRRGRGEKWNWAGLQGNVTVLVGGKGAGWRLAEGVAGRGGVSVVGKLPCGWGQGGQGSGWSVGSGSGQPGRKEGWPNPLAAPPLSLLPHYFPGAPAPSPAQLRLLSCRGLWTRDCTILLSQQGGSRDCPSQEVWRPRHSVGLLPALAWGSVCVSGVGGCPMALRKGVSGEK